MGEAHRHCVDSVRARPRPLMVPNQRLGLNPRGAISDSRARLIQAHEVRPRA
jgi:hypothetical protein